MHGLIDKIGQYRHRFFEKVMFSLQLKRAMNAMYRRLYKDGRMDLQGVVNGNHSDSLVAFNLQYMTFYEHVCDIAKYLDTETQYTSVFISPTRKPEKPYKVATYDFLQKQGITLGSNLVENPWLKHLAPVAFIETAISGYSAEVTCPKIIYTHGMGGLNFSKDLSYIKYVSRYDGIFLNGPLQRMALIAAQKKYGGTLPEMYEVGYIRGDSLINMEYTFDTIEFIKQLGLDLRPTVLFAPTWGKFSATRDWIDDVVRVCNELDLNLLLRLHPILLTGKSVYETGGVDWNQKVKVILAQNKNVRFVNSYKCEEVMLASTVMLTDVSGMAMEYMVLDRPVVFLPCKLYFDLYGSDRPEAWCRHDTEITSYYDLKREISKALVSKSGIIPTEKLIFNRGRSIASFHGALEDVIRKAGCR